ncbi:MAG TPA: glycoside hydrolase [Verrucomicrobiae bacterium]
MSRIFLRTFLAAAIFIFIFTAQLRAAETIPLDGEWRFAFDRTDAGVNEKWFARDLPDKIQLPGILQAQGYGDDITTNTPWVLTLGDAWWKIQPASLHDHFSQPGHVEVPFLSQPPKHYLGAAWYQRDIEIPTNWSGKHFTLFLERAHWQSTVWVDDKQFPANDSLVAPHITDLGVLTPGKHRLSIRVDNRTQLPAQGHLVDSHSVSDSLGAAWNGIVGKIELRATSSVWIEDLQVYPQEPITITNDNQALAHIVVKIKIGNVSGKDGHARLFVSSTTANVMWSILAGASWTTNGGETSIPLSYRNQTWDEFNPKLQDLTVTLMNPENSQAMDVRKVFFGLREISHNDKDLLINGRPVNLRLTHDGGEFPLTGYPAMDVASWKKIIQTCKDYGLNGMRFHSWCPPEAAFEAADELGFYLQPECGLWADFGSPQMKQWLNSETEKILAAYGNHPSFILLSPSNEPRNYSRFTPEWAATNYAQDNRRLYSAGTGWSDPSQVNGGAQFATLVRFGNGNLRGNSGWFGRDYRDALDTVHIPVLAHEVGQWCAYPDFDVMKKFTGYLKPGNYDIFKYIAEQNGVLDEDKDFAWASGRFQLQCYKEEIEANLRTPGLSGFQLLDLHDYLGQGTALIGVVDAFWQPKSYVTAEEFRKFCGPVVPLARLASRIYTSNQNLESDVEMYNFGEKPITNAMPQWEIENASGRTVASGAWDARAISIGKNIPLGKVSADLSKLAAPGAYKLVVKVGQASSLSTGGQDARPTIENDWNFWLYPAQVDTNTPSDVLVTRNWSEAATRLAAGGKVLFMPGNADLDPAKCPPMKNVPVFWNIQMTVRPPANRTAKFDAMLGLLCDTNHPALAEFPTDANCDWQWTQLVNNVRSVNLETAPHELRPIVWAIDDWNRNWKLGVIFECNVGAGKLLVSAINLDNERGGSELKQLRRSLLDYMAGEKFKPAATLTPEQVGSLWANASSAPASTQPARKFDPDLNDGTIPTPVQPKP